MPRIGDDLTLEPSLDEEDYIHDHRKNEKEIDEDQYLIELLDKYENSILRLEEDFG